MRFNEFSRATRLELWSEAVGLLLDVTDSTLIFDRFVLVITPFEYESIKHIKNLVGDVISILRTDIPGKEYIIRQHASRKTMKI